MVTVCRFLFPNYKNRKSEVKLEQRWPSCCFSIHSMAYFSFPFSPAVAHPLCPFFSRFRFKMFPLLFTSPLPFLYETGVISSSKTTRQFEEEETRSKSGRGERDGKKEVEENSRFLIIIIILFQTVPSGEIKLF